MSKPLYNVTGVDLVLASCDNTDVVSGETVQSPRDTMAVAVLHLEVQPLDSLTGPSTPEELYADLAEMDAADARRVRRTA